ncbi:hypothetical protein PWT90_00999 [Aphanocladium album]|nr:hypothetical protein PWT90_00999 [Aphanocladium album]
MWHANNSRHIVEGLHDLGKTVICYMNLGAVQPEDCDFKTWYTSNKWMGPWYYDANFNKNASKEENDANLYCERYVDFTDPTIRNLMKERMKIARDAGCDGVDPDNIDISGIKWGNGRNPPSPKSVFEALTDLAAYAHSMTSTYKGYKFMIGQKNAPEMAKDLAAKFDFAVLERGLEKNFAQEFFPYFNLKKPVIDIEYPADLLNDDDKNQPCNLQRDSSCAVGDTKCLCRGLNAPLDKWTES